MSNDTSSNPTKEEYPDLHTRVVPTFIDWFAPLWKEFIKEAKEKKNAQ